MRFLLPLLLLLSAPGQLMAGSSIVTVVPILIGDHELEGEFLVGPDCPAPPTDAKTTAVAKAIKQSGGGDRCYSGRIQISFEEPVGLLATSLNITAEVVNTDDATLVSRFPNAVIIPEEFPVLIKINDNAALRKSQEALGGGGFTFSNTWRLEVQTRDLEFEPNSPLRLFRSEEDCMPTACEFEDFTRSTGIGSFRASGSFGTFSEFIIVTDFRPPRVKVLKRYTDLDNAITDFAANGNMSPTAKNALQNQLNLSLTQFNMKNFEEAVDELYGFLNLIFFYDNGVDIEDDWDPNGSSVSVVGVLYGLSEALVFGVEDRARPQPISSGGTRQVLETPLPAAVDGGPQPEPYRMEVTVNFDQETSFQAGSLDIAAFEVDPLDPSLIARLPNNVSIDPSFPVTFFIGAFQSRRPAARGDWMVGFRTRGLDFQASSPFRLFKSDFGGNFTDVTTSLGVGSLIAGAHVGRFDEDNDSQYLIVRDQRAVTTVIGEKFGDIETMLSNFNFDSGLKATLIALEMSAKTKAMNNDYGGAIDDLDVFIQEIEDNAGDKIDDIWRSNDMRVNQAGLLSSRARTLQFSLSLAKSPLAGDPADVNGDGNVDVNDVFLLLERVYCPTGCPPQP